VAASILEPEVPPEADFLVLTAAWRVVASQVAARRLIDVAFAEVRLTPWRQAVDLANIAVHLARAHLVYGEWLRREQRRVEAREHLRAAHDMFGRFGAAAFAERARRELRATGETVHKHTIDTHDALTVQEAQVARLAAEGFTNPEIGAHLFISPRTAE
jgi:ATP/maltotriose-dependent transcriptional regulator MalT